jgi:polar amino acid transport system substrate-binding protein
MAVRVDDEALKSSLDSAINVLMQDGTIAQLESEWITNLSAENEPTNTELTKIEGAPTYYVGVSGDFPPLDYMAADGRPAGFNVAIMNKIAAVLGVNFEFVSLETQARFAALSSKKIDIIFCHFQSNDSSYFDDLKTNNWIGTMPYYTYKSGCFIVMK